MKGNGVQLELGYAEAASAPVLNCPSHASFLHSLASAILDGEIWQRGKPSPSDIPRLTIYLPTHGSVEPLKMAFLGLSPNGATFLPRIRVLGDSDPLDSFAAFGTTSHDPEAALALLEDAVALAQEAGDVERRIRLCFLVLKAARKLRSTQADFGETVFTNLSPRSALSAAAQIATLIGEMYSEGLDPRTIQKLDGFSGTGGEQQALQILKAVMKEWQAYKERSGKLDREERRNRMMAIESELVRLSDAPVIVAGSTGTIAATAQLMEAALARPQSAIVLHGLDLTCSTETWNAIGAHPEHPHYGVHHLLGRLRVRRDSIRDLRPVFSEDAPLSKRGAAVGRGGRPDGKRVEFLAEALRPASAMEGWAGYLANSHSVSERGQLGLSVIEGGSLQEEAAAIALILRESLEVEGQTAALVTPDEALLARVRHALERWGIAGGGEDTAHDTAGLFASRVALCAANGKPEDFVSLLRSADGSKSREVRRFGELIDLAVLRQMWRPASVSGIPDALARAEHAVSSGEARHPSLRRMDAAEWGAARRFAAEILDALSPIVAPLSPEAGLHVWANAHRLTLQRLEAFGIFGGFGESGAAALLDELTTASLGPTEIDLLAYASLFSELAALREKRKERTVHPRIFLWKPLDARLLTADIVVLGGLNEGSWPQTASLDPWLSRRDREFLGLPPLDRRTGLAAHDFLSLAASARQVYLTRARKLNGSLSKPSRWISRIEALAKGAGLSDALRPGTPWLERARSARSPDAVQQASRPQPRPPLVARPRRLSVTAIETWFANPYALYARHILGLDPLRGVSEASDSRDKGILYHSALHKFFQDYPKTLPADAALQLVRRLDKAAAELGFNLENAPFWRPRFARFAEWFAETEAERRSGVTHLRSECGGKLTLDGPAGPFVVTARADRIDVLDNGDLRIYDFKTSANTAKTSANRGAPQLALEGLLAREGAFAGIAAGAEAELCYIVATGGEPPGEVVKTRSPAPEAIQAAYSGLVSRIVRFDDPQTPYAYEARAIFREKAEYDPYAHLARVQEWSSAIAEQDDD
jgi:ATP-dependent helicase/nuclease subunit B